MIRAATIPAERQPRWTRLLRKSVTPIGAVRAVAGFTVALVFLSAFLMCVFDSAEFPTFGNALWWATQTITTVGYGDVVPHATSGRFVAAAVMLDGTAFVTVSTAAITATFIENVRKRMRTRGDVEELNERLARIEALLEQRR